MSNPSRTSGQALSTGSGQAPETARGLDRNEYLITGVIEEAPKGEHLFTFYLNAQWSEWEKTRLKVKVDERRGVTINPAVKFESGERILIKGHLQKNSWFDTKTKQTTTWYQLIAREIGPWACPPKPCAKEEGKNK